jgi:hypothetical protein
MAHTAWLRRRRRPSTLSIQPPRRKTAGVYHDNHPDPAADAALPVPVLSRQNSSRCPTFIPAFTAESKEHLGGFYIITAEDLDAAIGWASRVTRCINAPIEVRPFYNEAEADAAWKESEVLKKTA